MIEKRNLCVIFVLSYSHLGRFGPNVNVLYYIYMYNVCVYIDLLWLLVDHNLWLFSWTVWNKTLVEFHDLWHWMFYTENYVLTLYIFMFIFCQISLNFQQLTSSFQTLFHAIIWLNLHWSLFFTVWKLCIICFY